MAAGKLVLGTDTGDPHETARAGVQKEARPVAALGKRERQRLEDAHVAREGRADEAEMQWGAGSSCGRQGNR